MAIRYMMPLGFIDQPTEDGATFIPTNPEDSLGLRPSTPVTVWRCHVPAGFPGARCRLHAGAGQRRRDGGGYHLAVPSRYRRAPPALLQKPLIKRYFGTSGRILEQEPLVVTRQRICSELSRPQLPLNPELPSQPKSLQVGISTE